MQAFTYCEVRKAVCCAVAGSSHAVHSELLGPMVTVHNPGSKRRGQHRSRLPARVCSEWPQRRRRQASGEGQLLATWPGGLQAQLRHCQAIPTGVQRPIHAGMPLLQLLHVG